MEDSSGWSVRRTKLKGSLSVLLRMLKEKNTGCFSKRKGLFEWVGLVSREIKRAGPQTVAGGNTHEPHYSNADKGGREGEERSQQR